MIGVGQGNTPSARLRSEWHTPQWVTRTCTCPLRGGSMSTSSRIANGWPAASRTAAFILRSLHVREDGFKYRWRAPLRRRRGCDEHGADRAAPSIWSVLEALRMNEAGHLLQRHRHPRPRLQQVGDAIAVDPLIAHGGDGGEVAPECQRRRPIGGLLAAHAGVDDDFR